MDHAKGRVDLVGVYRLDVDDELIAEMDGTIWGEQYMPDPKARRAFLSRIVLVEFQIHNLPVAFSLFDICQPGKSERWASCFDHRFLTPDGNAHLADSEHGDMLPAGIADFRLAFHIREFDPAGPIVTPWGTFYAETIEQMPQRLKRLTELYIE